MPDLSLLDVAQSQVELLRSQDARLLTFSRKLVDILNEKTSAKRISVIIWNHLKSRFQAVSSLGFQESFKETTSIDLGKSVLGEVYREKKTIYCPNILLDKRFGIQKRFRYHSLAFISSPILLDNQVIGFVSLSNFEGNCHPIYQILVEKLCEDFTLKFEKEFSSFRKLKISNKDYKNSSRKFKDILKSFSMDGDIYLDPNPNKLLSPQSVDIFNCHVHDQCLQISFIFSKDDFLQRWNNFDWLVSVIKSLRETNVQNVSFLTKLNHLLLEVMGRKSDGFNINSFEIDASKRELNYISFDEGLAFVHNKGTVKTLNPNSSKFVSDSIKIRQNSIPFPENSSLIILSPAISPLIRESHKNLEGTVSNIMKAHSSEEPQKILQELQKWLYEDELELPNQSLIVIKG